MTNQIPTEFVGGPWDGLVIDLPDGNHDEIIVRNTKYWPGTPQECVYERRGCGQSSLTVGGLTRAVYEQVEDSDLMADNQRLRALLAHDKTGNPC